MQNDKETDSFRVPSLLLLIFAGSVKTGGEADAPAETSVSKKLQINKSTVKNGTT